MFFRVAGIASGWDRVGNFPPLLPAGYFQVPLDGCNFNCSTGT